MGDHELGEGLKLAATAVVSAALVAALVITVGGSIIDRQAAPVSTAKASPQQAVLVRTGG